MAPTDRGNWQSSDQKIDKKQEFYSHLCQLQVYMLDPSYQKTIKKKYATTVLFSKALLKQYNPLATADYTVQSLLDRSMVLSPFSISNSANVFKKELEAYSVAQLSSHINRFAQFLKHPVKNQALNSCLNKQYPKINIQTPLASIGKRQKLLTQLRNTALLYQKWIKNSKKQNSYTKLSNAVEKIHNDIANKPLHSVLINFQSKWSVKLKHSLLPQLTSLGQSLIANSSSFTKKTHKLLDKKLHSSIASLQKLTKKVCQKKVTNLHHDVFAVEEAVLKHSSKVTFPLPVISEDLAAYCYLNQKHPKKKIGSSWKSDTGLGIFGVAFIARIFNWIGKKTLIASSLTSTALFSADTYNNWKINSSQKTLYDIQKYHSITSAKTLKTLKKDQDLVHLDSGLLLLPSLVSKITNFVQARKIQRLSSLFKQNSAKTTNYFLKTYINSPSKWWPYYNSLIKNLKIKELKQFFWAKHDRLKPLRVSKSYAIRKKASEFFSRINQNYIAPARYLTDKDFVKTLIFLKNGKGAIASAETKAGLQYIQKLLKKTHLYTVNVNKIITQSIEATAQLKKLKSLRIKPKYFANNKKVTINSWPIAKNGEMVKVKTFTFNSYNEYKSFFAELKIKSNYLPTRAIDDLLQKKRLYAEQLKQGSNIRRLQIITDKLQLLQKTQKLNASQLKILASVKSALKNANIYPPNRAFKKIFLKELSAEVHYLKQGIQNRKAFVKKAYSSFPEKNVEALYATTSFLTNHLKQVVWTGVSIAVVGGTAKGVQKFGLDYIIAQFQDKMRRIDRIFTSSGYTGEEKDCALNSESFKKFMLCYNKLIKQEVKVDILRLRNFEFLQDKDIDEKDTQEYRLKLYSSIKKKLQKYTYGLLSLRSQFSTQELFYNSQIQINNALSEQFIYQVLKSIKKHLGEKSFQYAKSILTTNAERKASFKQITNLSKIVDTGATNIILLQNILYQVYSNQKKYSLYFKNTGQLPIELRALIKNKDLIELQELNESEKFNILSGGLLENVDFLQNLVF
ncbi:MAG: hypothetical protein HAW63_05545 [Bdellovibrionaceae bacterium]|nr:hypothetical protein [Pseudobdellovibrionaceae bacterium]